MSGIQRGELRDTRKMGELDTWSGVVEEQWTKDRIKL